MNKLRRRRNSIALDMLHTPEDRAMLTAFLEEFETSDGRKVIVRRTNRNRIELLDSTPEGRTILAEARRKLSANDFVKIFGRDYRWDFSPLNVILSAIVLGFTAYMVFIH